MKPPRYRLGLMLVTVSAVAWSTAGLFTRLIPLDSWTMLVWRGIFGALGIAVVILVMERRNAVASFQKMNWPSWLYAAFGALAMVFYITSLQPYIRCPCGRDLCHGSFSCCRVLAG